MRRLLGHPALWLAAQIVASVGLLATSASLDPQRVPDTRSYEIAAELDSLTERLGYYRSLGYPLFLRAVEGLGLDQQQVPAIQLAVYMGSVVLVWWALRRLTGSPWLGFAFALPLPWAPVVSLARRIQPDFLAAAATLCALAFVFLLAIAPRARWYWVGLVVSVAAAYHLRPAAVFLLGFIPLTGGLASWLIRARLGSAVRLLMLLAAATLLPYWSFCALRLVAVGHFGLVSFGGTNLAGLAANFVSGPLLSDLPDEHRRLAKRMLNLRRQMGLRPMRLGDPVVDYFAQYSDNIWKVANRAGNFELRQRRQELSGRSRSGAAVRASESWQRQPKLVARNTIVGAMSKAVIRARLHLYLEWVREAQLYGLRQLRGYLWIVVPFLGVMISLPVLLVRCRHAPAPEAPRSRSGSTAGSEHPSLQRSLAVITLVGCGYFFGYLLLVSLVSFPFERYFQSMIVFIPSVLCAQLYGIWCRILEPQSI